MGDSPVIERTGWRETLRQTLSGGSQDLLLLRFIAVGVFVDTCAVGMITPLLPSIAKTFALPQPQITSLLVIRGLTSILLSGPMGYLVQLLGHRNVLLSALMLTVLGSLSFAFAPSWHFLALAFFLQGLCSELTWGAGLSWAAYMYSPGSSTSLEDGTSATEESSLLANGRVGGGGGTIPTSVDGRERDGGEGGESNGLVGAIGILFGTASLGFLIGPFVGALIYQYTTTWMPFTLVAVFTSLVLALFLVSTSMKNTTSVGYTLLPGSGVGATNGSDVGSSTNGGLTNEKASTNVGTSRGSMQDGSEVDGGLRSPKEPSRAVIIQKEESPLVVLRKVSSNPKIASMLLVTIVAATAFGALEVLLPFSLANGCGMSTAQIGLVFGLCSVAYGASTSMAEYAVNLFGPHQCIIWGLGFMALIEPLLLIPGLSCSLILECILFIMTGLFMASAGTPVFPIVVGVLNDLGRSDYAVAVALYNSSYTIGTALGPLVASGFVSFMPAFVVIAITSVFTLGCIPVVLWGNKARTSL
eukprot:TRINITY_DN1413_c0_g1_i1.p1 TRINITY_DN1413_c0_g1~~TRINITY_DN1413_c0_g1_i1.p1  ORF type:complete len:529 (-),score=45.43 TRINITY_DN1413_c0_g1_i1:334-1920(-)